MKIECQTQNHPGIIPAVSAQKKHPEPVASHTGFAATPLKSSATLERHLSHPRIFASSIMAQKFNALHSSVLP